MTDLDVAACAADQIDWHRAHRLRPRLAGLTDEEYLFDPTGGSAWTVHPRTERRTPMQTGSGEFVVDFALPEPVPAPFTTIAWRMAHVVVGVLAVRSHGHFAGPEASYQSWAYAGTAEEAPAQLDREFARWTTGVHSLTEVDLARPCGPLEGPYVDLPILALVLHINRELIHHGAELALLRDLCAHTRWAARPARPRSVPDPSRTPPQETTMPFLTPTVTDERDALAAFASQQIRQVATTLQGLDADQLRATPTASAMSLGALARHVLFIGGHGPFAVLTDPGRAAEEPLDGAGWAAGAILPEAVRPEDTAESLCTALHALADRVEAGLRTADPEARIPVPDAPWFPQDLGTWPARWVALHMVEENARHAGHADILRESLDGRTAYELNALADGEQWSPES